MLRLCCCLLIAFASASAPARDFKYSSPNSGGCPEQTAEVSAADKAKVRPARAPAPVRETKPRPALHGDSGSRTSVRWHSFLPGMFR
ncbi:hypothetical protein [Cognatilysobacter bugurensis]|uniref:Secreted protein n=1 Tax=Cognatilysobacter bugurensis TaxID=543356 RepID=A0A918W979_9GAMM|nr:hypothetical protein [Lysobacter bugurensis]GHA83770.1 hypothetical protein GCM10007067_22370 [Lysobacter bugurensis]